MLRLSAKKTLPPHIKVNEYGLGEHKQSLEIDLRRAGGGMAGGASVSHHRPVVLVTVNHECESLP